tara:strand:- start:8 stop:697 length:690 start_codon:yes stop_codon:yes gene_type:complete
MIKKYFYNFYLILINLRNYGLYTIFKAFLTELVYLFKIRDFKSYIHDDEMTSSYQDTKEKKNYSTQHTATPYYFLTFVEKFIKKEKIDDFILVDLGCGYGRVGKYFSDKFNCLFYGLEINFNLLKDLISEKKNDKKFYIEHINLKDKVLRKKIFNKIISHKKKIIIFISDPFDIKTIIEIIDYFKNTKHYIVAINIKEYKKLLFNYNILNIKKFNIETRHIIFFNKKLK